MTDIATAIATANADRDIEITYVRAQLDGALRGLDAAVAKVVAAIKDSTDVYDVEVAESPLVLPALTQVELAVAALNHTTRYAR